PPTITTSNSIASRGGRSSAMLCVLRCLAVAQGREERGGCHVGVLEGAGARRAWRSCGPGLTWRDLAPSSPACDEAHARAEPLAPVPSPRHVACDRNQRGGAASFPRPTVPARHGCCGISSRARGWVGICRGHST